jgi:hypothetical protein
MIIISEYTITQEQIESYEKKNIRFAYGYEFFLDDYQTPYIGNKESVGFLLKDLYKSTIDLIERLLYFKHKVTLKYDDKVDILYSLDDWKSTVQSSKDALHTTTKTHAIYQAYLDKRREYLEDKRVERIRKHNEFVLQELGTDYDEAFLDTFRFRYQIEYDPESVVEKAQAYTQIKFYIDNNIEYSTPAPVIDYEDTPFRTMVDTSYLTTVEEPDVESYGNENFLEDVVYKTSTI